MPQRLPALWTRASDGERFHMATRAIRGRATFDEALAARAWAKAVLGQPTGPHLRILGWLVMTFQIWFRVMADRALTHPDELAAASRNPLTRGMAHLILKRTERLYP